jgi:hypothetical protein
MQVKARRTAPAGHTLLRMRRSKTPLLDEGPAMEPLLADPGVKAARPKAVETSAYGLRVWPPRVLKPVGRFSHAFWLDRRALPTHK